LDCPEDTCISRIGIRSQTSGRVDDNTESLKKRFVTFRNETIPNLDNLRKVTRVVSIPSDRDREEIFREVCEEFDKILDF
jgi:UMP-CMP kinase